MRYLTTFFAVACFVLSSELSATTYEIRDLGTLESDYSVAR